MSKSRFGCLEFLGKGSPDANGVVFPPINLCLPRCIASMNKRKGTGILVVSLRNNLLASM